MWKDRIDAAAAGGPRITYEALVDDYLSEAHRNYPGMGCPVSTLAGDLARSDKRTRAVVSRKIRDNIELLASLIRETNKMDKDTGRSCAVMTYCAMVGRHQHGPCRIGQGTLARKLEDCGAASEESYFVKVGSRHCSTNTASAIVFSPAVPLQVPRVSQCRLGLAGSNKGPKLGLLAAVSRVLLL
jgi:hypothetical protein